MLVLSAVQYALQSATFRTILGDFQESTLNVKRDAAQAILQEVKIATEDSLQRGEHTKFVNFAKQQAQLEEIEAFSFYDAQGTVALSSDQDRIGQPLDPKLWAQARESRTVFTTETADAMSLYCPLRVDADMLRLDPTRTLDEVYGVLSLEFSKNKINHMLAEAQDARAAGMRKVLGIVILSMAAITAVMVAAAV
ncbi:MAG: hypothetical protein JXA69_00085, partial [Phycisphaerae bacterium]|nr:hypothetical protein [Phycisphaerae bacterium]